MVLLPQLRQEDGGQAVRVAGRRPGGGQQQRQSLQEALGHPDGAQAHVLLRQARVSHVPLSLCCHGLIKIYFVF